MDSLARTLCGRRQDEEGPHEEDVSSRQESRGPILQENIAHQRQKDVFKAIEQCDLVHIKILKEQYVFKGIKDNHQRTPLHVLVDLKVEDEVLKELFMVLKEAGCDVNCVDEFGNTAVKLAAEKGCIQVLKCLLEEKADIEISDKFKQDTPLHWAAKNGMFEATALLIEHQAHLNPQNKDKQTPLHLAVQKKHIRIVYLLLLAGADKKLKDKNDFTPSCIATRAENKEIVELLNKSEEELYKMQTKDGQGEYVEPDSGASVMDCIPFTKIRPAQISFHYNVKVEGQATAAIGPNARVIHEQSNQALSLTTLVQAKQLPPPTPSPSTAGSPTAFPPAPEAQQLLPPTPSSSTAGSPTAFPPAPEAQQLLPPTPSPSTAGSPIALSPTPEARQLLPPTPSTSTAGSPTASSPAVVVPTAPLSPMDISQPLPSAPLVEEEDDAS